MPDPGRGAEANEWSALLERVRPWRHLGLLVDLDGTLAELAPRPEAARLRPDARRALERLIRADVRVAVVSGRALADVAERVSLEGAWVAGSHGAELLAPGGAPEPLVPGGARTDAALKAFSREARGFTGVGVLVEDKGLAVAAHVRGVEAAAQADVTAALVAQARALAVDGSVDWLLGKAVVEVRAPGATKGLAAAALLGRWPEGTSPIAIGDDSTDEDLFRVVAGCEGLTVKVGPEPSCAEARLSSPEAVAGFLSALAAQREGRA